MKINGYEIGYLIQLALARVLWMGGGLIIALSFIVGKVPMMDHGPAQLIVLACLVPVIFLAHDYERRKL